MDADLQELSKNYYSLQDVEIASLWAQLNTLTDVAQIALKGEIERRRLSNGQLSKLYSSRLREESKFDRRERTRRKWVVSYLLFRNDPKGTLIALIVGLVLALLAMLYRR